MACCGGGGDPIEGDKLHGVTIDELVNDKNKRNKFSDQVFHAFDKNKNGVLEKKEMQQAAMHLLHTFKLSHNVSLSDKEFNKIWKQTDVNGDGQVDKTEFRNFIGRIVKQSLSRAQPHKKGKKSAAKKRKSSSEEAAAMSSSGADADADDADEEDEEEEEEDDDDEAADSGDDEASASASGEGGDELSQFVAAHNKFRAKHGCKPLKNDPALNKTAAAWCKQLCADEEMKHSDAMTKGMGENLFCGSGKDFQGKFAVEKWYEEIDQYDFDNPGFSAATGHFTAMIWKEVKKVGFAKQKSKKGMIFIVAHYTPAPNMLGEFEENVPPPK